MLKIESPLTNSKDMEKLVLLLTNPVHQKKRHAVVQSHLKFFGNKTTLSLKDIFTKLLQEFLSKRENGQQMAPAYIMGLAATIQSKYGIKKTEIFKFMKNVQKVFNSENLDPIFISNDGQRFAVDAVKNKVVVNKTLPVYTDMEYDIIKEHYINKMREFVNSTRYPTPDDEVSLFVLLLASAPYRPSQLLALTHLKVNELVIKRSTVVKSKSGTGVDEIIIPIEIDSILQEYLGRLEQNNFSPSSLLFTKKHAYYWRKVTAFYEKKFNKSSKGKNVLRAFRNRFAQVAGKDDLQIAQKLLCHKSINMTRHYMRKQDMNLVDHKKREMMNKMWKSDV